jgi:acetylornithine deacetylase
VSNSRAILADLVAFDTTSRNSNLPLQDYVRAKLAESGIEAELFPDETGTKANLFATIGPKGSGGIILSGHTDCVPVEGQAWSSDPFTLTERDGKLYARGAADMKGFLACALAIVPALAKAQLSAPVHLALSYDEETGCTGVRGMIKALAARGERPAACLVGEPTGMGVVTGHKGGRSYRVFVTGTEAHSSLAPRAVNAIDYAAELIVFLRGLAAELKAGPQDEDYDVVHSTLSTGLIEGGTAINIVPNACQFQFEFRNLPATEQDVIAERVFGYARDTLLPQMCAVDPACDIRFEQVYEYPAHAIEGDHPLVTRMKWAVGSNNQAKVAFGTEAGLFQRDLGVPTVVCGPGYIDVAHRPDEYVEQSQLDRCDAALAKLLLSAG